MSLPRHARLVGTSAFSRVFKHPVVSADTAFRILARTSTQPHARLGMAVSRKVDRRAVARNRVKRIIRESFRQHYLAADGRAAPVTADFVVLPRPAAVTISNRQLFSSLARHWDRIDLKLDGAGEGGRTSGAARGRAESSNHSPQPSDQDT